MKKNLYLLFILLFLYLGFIGLFSMDITNCYSYDLIKELKADNKNGGIGRNLLLPVQDTVYIRDTVYIKAEPQIIKEYVTQIIPELTILDSLQTATELDNILAYGFITYPSKDGLMPTLYESHLSLLPYLYYIFSSDKIVPRGNYQYLQNLTYMCTSLYTDCKLFELGKFAIEKVKQNVPHSYGNYVSSYPAILLGTRQNNNEKAFINERYINIDSLRVKVIAYNDREALQELEKYYHDKGDDKGIAIYYKVLLSYEGNGDLAERFYKVLEPYFETTPEFKSAVREVLLRAAICDHNARAQELCDSLGFSLCDYRLPLPK